MEAIRRHIAQVAALCAVVACAGLLIYRRAGTAPAHRETFTIGYGVLPPYSVPQKDGNPSGFAVEILREAAKRAGIDLQWKRITAAPDEPLIEGEIDLYPMLASVPGRVGRMEFSEPWWENTLVVVSRPSAPIQKAEDAAGKKITLLRASLGLLSNLFPGSVPIPETEYAAIVRNVCTGAADGAIIEMHLADGLSLMPQCSGMGLTAAWFPRLNLTYGVGARLGLKPVADRLQAEILRMAHEGRMTQIGEPWGVEASNQRKLLDALAEVRLREQRWQDVVGGTALLLLLAMAQTYRVRKERAKAERALAIRSEFLANISHEIRTPLNGLLGMTEILRNSPLDSAQRDCAKVLESSGQTLLALINQLLDFSKLEAGKMQAEAIGFSLHDLPREVVQLFDARASTQGVLIECEIDAGVPESAVGDPVRIRQILNNLVSNAVKFTGRGSVRLRVLPVSVAEKTVVIRFDVVDTGCGLAPEQFKRIFEPFTQADGTTSRRFGGTGLGLSICKDLATLLGGKIGLESEVGKGSTFWVEIPLGIAEQGVDDIAVATEDQRFLGLHVLVAEDNPVNQRVITSHLAKLGCTWSIAGNGLEAVAAAGMEHFDAVLMDGQMPLVDGFMATQQIRKLLDPYGQVPIIGVTACAFEDDRQRCLSAGMELVLTKPFTLAALRRALTTVRRIPAPPAAAA